MSASDRFYVWRAEVWGGSHVWEIWERAGFKGRRVKTWKTETQARKDCELRNQQWGRYQAAMWHSHKAPS
jgi:hypothetical protein